MTDKAPSPRADYEQLLVEAGRADVPPTGARERMLASIGVSAGATLAGAKAAAASVATGVGGVSSTAVLVKALIWGTMAGAVGMGIAHSWPEQAAKKPVESRPASASSSATELPVANVTPPKASVSAEPTAEPGKLDAQLGAPRPVAPKAQVSSSAGETDASEVLVERQLLDSARKALAAGRGSSAMKSLNDYTERFGFGVLGHEATVLRMEALLALGRPQDARELGEWYMTAHPHGVQIPAVRRLLGSSETNVGPAPAASDQNSGNRQ